MANKKRSRIKVPGLADHTKYGDGRTIKWDTKDCNDFDLMISNMTNR